MSCTQCGAQLYEGQKFCGNCGARVTDAEAARSGPTADSDPASPDRPAWASPTPAKGQREFNKPAVIAASVALIVILAGAGAYLALMRPSGKEEIARSDYPQDTPGETARSPEPLPSPAEEAPKSKAGSAAKKPPASRARSATPAAPSRNTAAAGTYEAVRDTSVYESPSASSKVVASIPRGYTVEVLGSTGNWLEVRSRSGNPPGFIRRSDALPTPRRG